MAKTKFEYSITYPTTEATFFGNIIASTTDEAAQAIARRHTTGKGQRYTRFENYETKPKILSDKTVKYHGDVYTRKSIRVKEAVDEKNVTISVKAVKQKRTP